jgi:hypothetical protein
VAVVLAKALNVDTFIIELLILTFQWRQSSGQQLEWAPNEKSGYLKVRIFFDSPFFGQVGIADVTESTDTKTYRRQTPFHS